MGLMISKALPGLRARGLVHMSPSQGPQREWGSAPAQGQSQYSGIGDDPYVSRGVTSHPSSVEAKSPGFPGF